MASLLSLCQFEANGHARRLGGIENYFAILQRQKIYKNFVVKARFNLALNNQLLFKALRNIILKYPIVGTTIVKSDYSDLSTPKPVHDYIKILHKLQLKDVLIDLLEFKGLSDEELYPKLNNIVLEYENEVPFWRIGFLDDFTLVFISNHMMSDGISGKNLIEDIEQEFNKIKLEINNDDYLENYLLNYATDQKLLPPIKCSIDKVVNYVPPWTYAIEYIWNTLAFKFTCTCTKISDRTDTHTYRTFKLSNEQLIKLKSYLKTQVHPSATLTPFFATAWLEAVSEVTQKNSWFQTNSLSIPCNSRQYIPDSIDIDPYRYGANTSGFHKYFFPIREITLSTIKTMTDYFKYQFDSHKYLYNIGILTLDFVAKRANLDKATVDSIIGVSRSGCLMSNIGLMDHLQHDSLKYKVEDMVFFQNAGGTLFSFTVNIIALRDNGSEFVVTMVDNDKVSVEQFDQIIKRFQYNLNLKYLKK